MGRQAHDALGQRATLLRRSTHAVLIGWILVCTPPAIAAFPLESPPGIASAAEAAPAPENDRWLKEYNVARLQRGVEAMTALTAWGGVNVLAGAIGWPLAQDEQWQAFHGMNLGWGTVNLAIAIPSLVRNLNADPGSFDLTATLRAEHALQTTLMINLGLDVAYMTAGVLMWERGDFGDDPLLLGFGRSLVIQGAFLLAFDIVYYVLSADISANLYTRVRDGGIEAGLVGRF